MNRYSQNPRVPAAQHTPPNVAPCPGIPGVRVHYFLLVAIRQFPFRLQLMTTLKEGDRWQMWEFIRVTA